MLFKLFQTKATALALGLIIFSLGNAQGLQASPTVQFVTPAQAFVQGTNTFTPALKAPIPFNTIDIKENIKIEADKSVFKIEQSGFYVIRSTLSVMMPAPGQSSTMAILINGKSYVYFEQVIESSIFQLSPSNGAATLYLEEGDKISVALLDAPAGTTVGARQLTIIGTFNTKD